MKLLVDFFPVLAFFIAYKIFDIFVATAVAIAASLIQVLGLRIARRRIETMHLVTLGLVVVFGGLTLLLQDRTFFMWKPTIVNWLFATAFLGSHFVGERPLVERMISHAIEVPGRIWRRLNLMWFAFFLLSGAANLYVANHFFTAENALLVASGKDVVDLASCSQVFSGEVLDLCTTAHAREETWVNFKLFGMMGLTIVFVIVQAFYLARHIRDTDKPQESD